MEQQALLEAVRELHAEVTELHRRSGECARRVGEVLRRLQGGGEGPGTDQRPPPATLAGTSPEYPSPVWRGALLRQLLAVPEWEPMGAPQSPRIRDRDSSTRGGESPVAYLESPVAYLQSPVAYLQSPGPEGPGGSPKLVRRSVERLCRSTASPLKGDPEPAQRAEMLDLEVHILRGVHCASAHRAWVLELLQRQAGSLRELELFQAGRAHLLEVQRMPRLRVLHVASWHGDLAEEPALPGTWRGKGLRLLRANLPRETLQCLLRLNQHSLQEVELAVGTEPPAGQREEWPYLVADLPAVLRGLLGPQLRSLSLLREKGVHLDEALCAQQLAGLRAVLPGCAVTCSKCGLAL